MKFKIAFILLLFMIKVGICQKITSADEVKGKKITYKKIDGPTRYGKAVVYSNTENELYKVRQILPTIDGHHFPDPNDLKIDYKKIYSILLDVLSLERLEALRTQKRYKNVIYMRMYFLPNGTLKEVTFGVHEDSPLDVRGLEKIERLLKKEIYGWYEESNPSVWRLQESNYILLAPGYYFEDIIAFKKDPGWFEADRRRRWYGDE